MSAVSGHAHPVTRAWRQRPGLSTPIAELTAVILAGGRASRMGGNDKGLIALNGKPMIAHLIDRLRPQAGQLVINANRNLTCYQQYGFPVVTDRWPDFPGPLAGLASALPQINTDYILCSPCDTPHLPADVAARLYQALAAQQSDVAIAMTGDDMQATCFLIRRAACADLERYLTDGGRQVQRWLRGKHWTGVDFADQAKAFANINTPEELAQAGKGLYS